MGDLYLNISIDQGYAKKVSNVDELIETIDHEMDMRAIIDEFL